MTQILSADFPINDPIVSSSGGLDLLISSWSDMRSGSEMSSDLITPTNRTAARLTSNQYKCSSFWYWWTFIKQALQSLSCVCKNVIFIDYFVRLICFLHWSDRLVCLFRNTFSTIPPQMATTPPQTTVGFYPDPLSPGFPKVSLYPMNF